MSVIVIALIAIFSCLKIREIESAIDDAYAVEEVTDLICEYFLASAGEPPKRWPDLERIYKHVDRGYGRGIDGLEELKSLVEVDFEFLSKPTGSDMTMNTKTTVIPYVRIRRQRDNADFTPAEIRANERIDVIRKRKVNQVN